MPNMKDIKNRMKSVGNTMQITKAMELVASSKLRRAKQRTEKARPYFKRLYETMERIATENRDFTSIYTKKREIKSATYIVVAGDRGLAGGYNANVLKMAKTQMGPTASVITVGKKSADFFEKQPNTILHSFYDIAETISFQDVDQILKMALTAYEKKETDALYIAYTEFVSPLTQEAKLLQLLPIRFEAKTTEKTTLTQYDPSPEEVFDKIVPAYLSGMVFGAIVESFASEQGARRVAMESASDNAVDVLDKLNLSYNRARQGAITQEITEIVAGSKAAK